MAKKKEVTDKKVIEIKKLLKTRKLVIGSGRTVKNLRLGKIERVFLTANCPNKVVEDISRYAKLSKSSIVRLKQDNEDLGIICKKPFSISVLSVLKGG